MNEKTKIFMQKQRVDIYNHLKSFGLAVYEDVITQDQEGQLLNADNYNFFIVAYGDFQSAESKKRLTQTIAVDYYSENRDDVDATTIDIISKIQSVAQVEFDGSRKDSLRVKDTDRFVDRVTILFKRGVPIECKV